MKVLIEEISSTSQINQLEDLIKEINYTSPISIELITNSNAKKLDYLKKIEKLIKSLLDYSEAELKELELNQYYLLIYNLIYFSQILKKSSLYQSICQLLNNCLNYLINLEKLEEAFNFIIIKEIKPSFNNSTTSTSGESNKSLNLSKLVTNQINEIEVGEQLWKVKDCRAYYYLNWVFSSALNNYNLEFYDNLLLNHLPFITLLILDYESQYKLQGLNYYLIILNTINSTKLIGRGIPLILKQNYSTFLGFINDSIDLFKALINTFLRLITIINEEGQNSEEYSEILIRKILLYTYFTFDNNQNLIELILLTLIDLIKTNQAILLLDFEQAIKLSISIQSSLKFDKNNNTINLNIIKLNCELLTLILKSKLKKNESFAFEVFSSCLKIWYFSISLFNKSLESNLNNIKIELDGVFNTLINVYNDKIELFKIDINQFLSHPLLKKYNSEFDWILVKLE